MRVLHVGWGFSPWRPGGLIMYAEDLMAAQAARGHEVSYFLSGRHYPYISGPRLKGWRRGPVTMHEVINSPVIGGMEAGTRNPLLELNEPHIEAMFERLLARSRPDVIHIQELHGLPSSLIEVAAAAGVPMLMTLQDYYPLCATLRLFDSDARVCLRHDVGADCVARNARAPLDAGHLVGDTTEYEMARAGQLLNFGDRADLSFVAPLVGGVVRKLARAARERNAPPPPAELDLEDAAAANASLAEAFQQRRDVNIERLGRVDRLVAQSGRVADIYRHLRVSGDRLTTLPFTLSHISKLRPRQLTQPPAPITFATLNGCASATKGLEVILGALRVLRAAGLEGSFRLRVLGRVEPRAVADLLSYAGVELLGLYEPKQLDSLLDGVDVGIMPSIWEEAFGYTGTEMIAKGIPLIANPLGGIVEYAIAEETAWINRSCSGEELAEHMQALIADPQQVVDMHRSVVAARDRLVVPMAQHVEAIETMYRAIA